MTLRHSLQLFTHSYLPPSLPQLIPCLISRIHLLCQKDDCDEFYLFISVFNVTEIGFMYYILVDTKNKDFFMSTVRTLVKLSPRRSSYTSVRWISRLNGFPCLLKTLSKTIQGSVSRLIVTPMKTGIGRVNRREGVCLFYALTTLSR